MNVWPRDKTLNQEQLQEMMHKRQEQEEVRQLADEIERTLAEVDGDPVFSSFAEFLEDMLDEIDEAGLLDGE